MTDTPDIVERLDKMRAEMIAENVNGWPNTCVDVKAELLRLRGEVERLTQEAALEDEAHGITVDQRDTAERALSEAYRLVTGEIPKWSNNFGFADALREIEEDVEEASDCKARVDALQAQMEKVREADPDWWYCDVDPDDSGYSPHEALRNEADFSVVLLHSSYVGPDKYAFRADTLATDDNDNEVLLFDTEEEAIAAAEERRIVLASLTEGGTNGLRKIQIPQNQETIAQVIEILAIRKATDETNP